LWISSEEPALHLICCVDVLLQELDAELRKLKEDLDQLAKE
jgi:hypothetical protein